MSKPRPAASAQQTIPFNTSKEGRKSVLALLSDLLLPPLASIVLEYLPPLVKFIERPYASCRHHFSEDRTFMAASSGHYWMGTTHRIRMKDFAKYTKAELEAECNLESRRLRPEELLFAEAKGKHSFTVRPRLIVPPNKQLQYAMAIGFVNEVIEASSGDNSCCGHGGIAFVSIDNGSILSTSNGYETKKNPFERYKHDDLVTLRIDFDEPVPVASLIVNGEERFKQPLIEKTLERDGVYMFAASAWYNDSYDKDTGVVGFQIVDCSVSAR